MGLYTCKICPIMHPNVIPYNVMTMLLEYTSLKAQCFGFYNSHLEISHDPNITYCQTKNPTKTVKTTVAIETDA